MKKFWSLFAIIAMVFFIMPSCEKDSVKEDDDESNNEQVGSNTNSKVNKCWEITLICELNAGPSTEIIYTWGTEADVKKYAEAIAEINEQDPEIVSCKSSVKATNDSEKNCENYNEYWDIDAIIAKLEDAGWLDNSGNGGNSGNNGSNSGNGGNSGTTNSAQCWEMVFTSNELYEGERYTETIIWYTWGTKQEATETAEQIANMNTESWEDGYTEMTVTAINAAEESEYSCKNRKEYW